MTTLESLTLPPGAKDIEFLRKFPKLKRLGYKFDATVRGPNQTADEFWADFDRSKGAAAP